MRGPWWGPWDRDRAGFVKSRGVYAAGLGGPSGRWQGGWAPPSQRRDTAEQRPLRVWVRCHIGGTTSSFEGPPRFVPEGSRHPFEIAHRYGVAQMGHEARIRRRKGGWRSFTPRGAVSANRHSTDLRTRPTPDGASCLAILAPGPKWDSRSIPNPPPSYGQTHHLVLLMPGAPISARPCRSAGRPPGNSALVPAFHYSTLSTAVRDPILLTNQRIIQPPIGRGWSRRHSPNTTRNS